MEWLGGGQTRQQFEAFVDGALDSLYRTGYLLTQDASDCEDLLQETFLRIARRWARVRSMDHPVAYARRILVNLALDDASRRSRSRDELAVDRRLLDHRADESSGRVLQGIDDLAEFEWALAMLTARQRAVLTLRYWDDLSEVEIAEALGCPLGTVKSTASRAMHQLRTTLSRRDPDGRQARDDEGATMADEGGGRPC